MDSNPDYLVASLEKKSNSENLLGSTVAFGEPYGLVLNLVGTHMDCFPNENLTIKGPSLSEYC